MTRRTLNKSGSFARCAALLLTLSVNGCTPKPEPVPKPTPHIVAGTGQRADNWTPSSIPPPAVRKSRALVDLPHDSEKTLRWGEGADATSTAGVVTTVDISATTAGIQMLERGGNAIDAAVAAAFALAVTHPSAGNIGGGGFLVLKLGEVVEAIDFRENSPAALTDATFWKMIKAGGRGPTSVGVPGTVAGLFLAHKNHGKLAWKEVVAPAVTLAEEGYKIGDRQVKTIGWAQADLARDPVARAAFLKTGAPPLPGSVVKRPLLAKALKRIRDEGPDGFYKGPTAADIVASLGEEGLITLKDLESYRAQVREPLYFDFGDTRVITMPAPSAGGVALTQTLLMLQAEGVSKTEPGSAARFHLFAEASRRAQAERQLFVVAPDWQTRAAQVAGRARALDPQTWLKDHPIDRAGVTESKTLHTAYDKVLDELEHTTHLSVIDGSGGLVSLTVTLSGSFGARLFTKETGIVLNNSTASFSSVGVNTPQAARRTTSSMAPTLALLGDRGALVLGSPGGDTIPSTVSQLLLHLVVDGSSLKEAVDAPRLHQTFAPGDLTQENSLPLSSDVKRDLAKLGHKITSRRSAIGDGNVDAMICDETYAVCDAREGGAALAAKTPLATPGKPPDAD